MKTIKLQLNEHDAAILLNILEMHKKSPGFQFWMKNYQDFLNELIVRLEGR